MAYYCQNCGALLKGTAGRMRCPTCGEKSIAREKRREPEYSSASFYIRWLLTSIQKNPTEHGGVFLLETYGSMGKTSFWKNIAWNVPREEQYEELHLLWCDWGGTLQGCHNNLRKALEEYGCRLSPDFSAEVLQPDLSDRSARMEYVLKELGDLRKEFHVSTPLVLVLDNVNTHGMTGELLLELLPAAEALPEGVFVVLSLTGREESGFFRVLDEKPFTRKLSLHASAFSYDQMIKKIAGKHFLHLNLKQYLTDGERKVQQLCRLAQNRWSHIGVARQILQDFGEMRFFRIEEGVNLVEALLALKREQWGEEIFDKDLRILLLLTLLRQPVAAEKCFPSEEDPAKAMSQLYLKYYSLVELSYDEEDRPSLQLRSNGFREFFLQNYRPQIDEMIEDFLALLPEKTTSPDQLMIMTYLPDIIHSYGTEEQNRRLFHGKWPQEAVGMANLITASPQDLLEFYSEYIGGLLLTQLPHRGRWMAEAYLQREELHGCLGDFRGQLHDYSAAIHSLRELPELSKNEQQILCNLYEERGKLYAHHRNLEAGLKNMEKALHLNREFTQKGDVAAMRKMPELYLTRAKMQAVAGADEGAEKDYRTAIDMLRRINPEDIRIAGVYSEWGGIAMKRRDVEQGIRFYQKAVDFLMEVRDLSSAEWKEQAAFAYSLLGKAWLRKKEYKKALQELTEAVRLRENLFRNKQLSDPILLARAYGNRGSVLSLMDRDEEALDDYSRAITMRVNHFDRKSEAQVMGLAHIYLNRGALFRKYNRTMEEIMEYSHGIRLLSKLILRGKIKDENVFLLCAKLYQYRIQGYQKLGNEAAVQEDFAAMDALTAAQKKK